MIYSFGDLPPAQALAALSPIAEMQGEEEDVESLKAIWLLANVGAQGMDALIGMDEAGQLNEHTMQDILYNRGYHTDEICAMVPELSACARSAKLRFVRGHPPVYSAWDFCGTQECVTAHHETIDACADRVEGNTYYYESRQSRECRDDALIELFARRPRRCWPTLADDDPLSDEGRTVSEVVRGLLEMHFTGPECQGGCGGQVTVRQVQVAAGPLATSWDCPHRQRARGDEQRPGSAGHHSG